MNQVSHHNSEESLSSLELEVATEEKSKAWVLTTSRKLVALNAASSVSNQFLMVLIYIFITPYLLSCLGVDVYGVIPLVASVAAYSALISLGLSMAINRYVTYDLARGDIEQASRYISTAFFSTLFLSLVMLIPVTAISYFFPQIFHVPAGNETASRVLMFIIGADMLVMTATSPLGVAFYARQRFYIQNIFSLLGSLFRVAVIVVLFEFFGSNLIYLGIGAAVAMLTVVAARVIFFRILLRGVKISAWLWSKACLKKLSSFSLHVVISQVSTMIFLHTDYILINLYLRSSEVAVYSLAATFIILLRRTTGSIVSVVTPAVTIFDAKNNSGGIEAVILSGTRYVVTWLCLPTILLGVFASDLMATWVGSRGEGAVVILWALVLPGVFTIGAMPTSAVLTGLGKIKVVAWVSLAASVFNIGLSLFLMVPCKMGALGVAVATSTVFVLKDGLFIPLFTCHICRVNPWSYYRTFFRPILAVVPTICLALGAVTFFDLVGWDKLIFAGLVVSLPFLILVYRYVLNKEEAHCFKRYVKMIFFRKGALHESV